MTREELVAALARIRERQDDPADAMYAEDGHVEADQLLLEFIDDPAVTAAFNQVGKWYA